MSDKIVLYGPPLAGKVTLAQSFADAFSGRAKTFEVPVPEYSVADVGIQFWATVRGLPLEIVTFSGGVFGENSWRSSISTATGLALVVDARREKEDQGLKFARLLRQSGNEARARCVILTHDDLIRAPDQRIDADVILREANMEAAQVFRVGLGAPITEGHPLMWLASKLATRSPT